MAGYDWTNGKSKNAISAEQEGLLTATALGKALNCSSRAIKAHLAPSEWHHTSRCFNCTYYYDEPLLLALVGQGDREQDWTDEQWSSGQELLAKLRSHGKAKVGGAWSDCRVQWLEWSGVPGSRSRRNRPRATEREATGCSVTWSGKSMIAIVFPDGSTLRKKIDCRGLAVTLADGSQLLGASDWRPAEDRLREAVTHGK